MDIGNIIALVFVGIVGILLIVMLIIGFSVLFFDKSMTESKPITILKIFTTMIVIGVYSWFGIEIYNKPKQGDIRETCGNYEKTLVTKEINNVRYLDTEKKCNKTIREIYINQEWKTVLEKN